MTGDQDTEMSHEPDFDPETGLIPAVVQHAGTGRVRMLGYMNRASLERTRRTGRVTFYSRSRKELWEKGSTSGNWLEARSMELDCDGDALLVRAVPHGPTCHTGRESCFDGPELWEAEAGGDAGSGDAARAGPSPAGGSARGSRGEPGLLGPILTELLEVVAERDRERPEGSYTARLLEDGPGTAGRKVAEEALEVALAAASEPDRVDEESADLLYHLVVLWRSLGIEPDEVANVLDRRRSPAGRNEGGSSGAGESPARSGTGSGEDR